MKKEPFLFAVSGVKNSGKTTLIGHLLPVFSKLGVKTAVIKHDGHEFEADVPGTDSYSYMQAGAYGAAVFSGTKFLLVKQEQVTERALARQFPEADLILLEGMKYSPYPKLELVRRGNSERPVCDPGTLAGIVTDIDGFQAPKEWAGAVPAMRFSDIGEIAETILDCRFMRTELSMAVLAGGLSSRMGRDKAGLLYHGQTFLQRQMEKGIRLGIDDLLVSGYRGEADWKVVPDRFKEKGPLGGLEAVFGEASHSAVLVLPVDVPQLPLSAIKRLVRTFRKSGAPAVVLSHGGRIEPLMGIYRTDLAKLARTRLEMGAGSVMAFLKEAGYETCEAAEPEGAFQNVNTPDVYEKLVISECCFERLRKTFT